MSNSRLGRQANVKAQWLRWARVGGLRKPSFQFPSAACLIICFFWPSICEKLDSLARLTWTQPWFAQTSLAVSVAAGRASTGLLRKAACVRRQISRTTPPTNPDEASSGTETWKPACFAWLRVSLEKFHMTLNITQQQYLFYLNVSEHCIWQKTTDWKIAYTKCKR